MEVWHFRGRIWLPLCESIGRCEERCHFNETALVYLLELQDNISELQADFKANTVTLGVPKALGSDWYANNKVGFEHTMTLTDGNELFKAGKYTIKVSNGDKSKTVKGVQSVGLKGAATLDVKL